MARYARPLFAVSRFLSSFETLENRTNIDRLIYIKESFIDRHVWYQLWIFLVDNSWLKFYTYTKLMGRRNALKIARFLGNLIKSTCIFAQVKRCARSLFTKVYSRLGTGCNLNAEINLKLAKERKFIFLIATVWYIVGLVGKRTPQILLEKAEISSWPWKSRHLGFLWFKLRYTGNKIPFHSLITLPSTYTLVIF